MPHNFERVTRRYESGKAGRAWDAAGRLYHVYRPRTRNQVWTCYGILDNIAQSFSADTLGKLCVKLEQHH